jgi:hypothetical protein
MSTTRHSEYMQDFPYGKSCIFKTKAGTFFIGTPIDHKFVNGRRLLVIDSFDQGYLMDVHEEVVVVIAVAELQSSGKVVYKEVKREGVKT